MTERQHRTAEVPLTRRLLAVRPARTVAGSLGIGMALMLMLLLNGLWAGVQDRVTTYEDHLRADLVVVPAGTQSLFADAGTLPAGSLDTIRSTPGVRSAVPIRTMYLILELGHGKAAVASVSSDPGAPGGPWAFAAGRAPVATDEIAVDKLFADEHGLSIGARVPVLGHPMRVVGLTEDTAMFMMPLVFTTNDAVAGMLRTGGAPGAVLVDAADPVHTAAVLRGRGLTVRTPADLHETALRQATAIYGSPIRLMVAVAFAAGTLIVALVAYTRVVEQQRDLGVLKALGATPARVRRIAIGETAVLTFLGALAAVLFLLVTREVLAWWWPAFPVVLTNGTLTRTAVAAAAMALLAAWLPAHRLASLDAASAFRGAR